MAGEREEHVLETRLDDAQVLAGDVPSTTTRGPRRVTLRAPGTSFSQAISGISHVNTTCSSGS